MRFWWHCLAHFPYLVLLVPLAFVSCMLRVLRLISKETFLCMMEIFEIFVPNKKRRAEKFWNKNIKHVKKWYLEARRNDDVIVSASPDYLIEEICRRLGVRWIATKTRTNGMAKKKHCYGEEKVKEFQRFFPETRPKTYYSDSLSDTPMMKFAERGYFVRGEKITQIFENGEKIST